jgi:hypothetical protein
MRNTFQNDFKIKELEKAVMVLCETHLTQKTENLSVNHKKLLQAVFGENILNSNLVRDKIIKAKELI